MERLMFICLWEHHHCKDKETCRKGKIVSCEQLDVRKRTLNTKIFPCTSSSFPPAGDFLQPCKSCYKERRLVETVKLTLPKVTTSATQTERTLTESRWTHCTQNEHTAPRRYRDVRIRRYVDNSSRVTTHERLSITIAIVTRRGYTYIHGLQ